MKTITNRDNLTYIIRFRLPIFSICYSFHYNSINNFQIFIKYIISLSPSLSFHQYKIISRKYLLLLKILP